MSLINNDQVIAHLRKIDLLSRDHAIASHQNTAAFSQCAHLLLPIGLLLVVELHHIVDILAPLLQLTLPVHLHSSRHHDKHSADMLAIKEALAQCGHLDSLAQAHIIAQDSALLFFVQIVEPDHTFLLVLEKSLVVFGRQTEVIGQAVLLFFRIVFEATFLLAFSKLELVIWILIIVVVIRSDDFRFGCRSILL